MASTTRAPCATVTTPGRATCPATWTMIIAAWGAPPATLCPLAAPAVANAEGTVRPTTPAGVEPVAGLGAADCSARATRMAKISAAMIARTVKAATACQETWIRARRSERGVVTSAGPAAGRCRPRGPLSPLVPLSAGSTFCASPGKGTGGSGIQPNGARSRDRVARASTSSCGLRRSTSMPSKARARAVTGDGGEERGIRTTLWTSWPHRLCRWRPLWTVGRRDAGMWTELGGRSIRAQEPTCPQPATDVRCVAGHDDGSEGHGPDGRRP